MGYRSQVHMTIVGPAEQMVPALVTFRMSEPKHFSNLMKELQYRLEGDDFCILFRGNDWKWYHDYDDVAATTALFDHFENIELDKVNGAFARIGEDDGDIETHYFGDDPYDLIYIVRKIESDYVVDPDKPFGVIPEWTPKPNTS